MNRYPTSLQHDISLLEELRFAPSTSPEKGSNVDTCTSGTFDVHNDVDDETFGDERNTNHYEKVALALQLRIADKQVLHAIIENAASL